MSKIFHSFKTVFSNRQFAAALAFVILLYGFEEWLFNFPQREFFHNIVIYRPQNEVNEAILSGLLSFIFCFLFVWAALGSSKFFRWLYLVLFAIPLLVQYGFWKAVGRFMSMPDLQIAGATSVATWRGAGALYFDWHFILPLVAFLLMLLLIKGNQVWKTSLAALAGLSLFALLLGGFYIFLTSSAISLGASLSSFYQTITLSTAENVFPTRRETVKIQQFDRPQGNIVLIIDESIRGDHLSINGYNRETTPFLDSFAHKDYLQNWGLAVAGATCSYPSNALILTGVRPGMDQFEKVTKYPTLFQYAKAMGYTTYYIDDQTNTLWNGLGPKDLIYVDKWYKASDLGEDEQIDFRAADLINQIVSGGTGNLIVLNKRGVHFLYEESYPTDAAVWKPIPTDYQSQPGLVKNPYDNGVHYNVNTFFERLFQSAELLDKTIILYTSDHGDTVFEDGTNWLHCNFTAKEATVPLMVFGRNLPPADLSYHAGHENILPSILDLMKVPLDKRAHPYAPSLFSATAAMNTTHFFFNGNLDLIQYPDHYPEK